MHATHEGTDAVVAVCWWDPQDRCQRFPATVDLTLTDTRYSKINVCSRSASVTGIGGVGSFERSDSLGGGAFGCTMVGKL